MSWQFILPALTLGLLSSLHCVGMCGAIAFSLPTQSLAPKSRLAGTLLYNLGRIATYCGLGLVFGIFGRQLYLAGMQQTFSIVAGVAVLVWLVAGKFIYGHFNHYKFGAKRAWLQNAIAFYLRKPGIFAAFVVGVANGFLPCGLVYLALTGAIATGSLGGAAMFMALFGAGTLPAMFAMSWFGVKASTNFRNRLRRVVPFALGIMATLLVLRGLGLGIPYLSPQFQQVTAAVNCH